ncbi:MAG TPA: hypothetical protein DEO85_02920 [Maritimibacter sp.]|nr:hypothetical protein [Maritimibacter sp.]
MPRGCRRQPRRGQTRWHQPRHHPCQCRSLPQRLPNVPRPGRPRCFPSPVRYQPAATWRQHA